MTTNSKPRNIAHRPPRLFDAHFAWLQPGDILLHPKTGEHLAVVRDVTEGAQHRKGKPPRFRFTVIADAICIAIVLLISAVAHAGTLDCSPMATRCYIADAVGDTSYLGGIDADWLRDEAAVRARGQIVEIAGGCYSNCANAADRLRPLVCLYPTARLYFHKSRSADQQRIYSEHITPGLHADVLALIAKHGGWKPADNFAHHNDYVEIDYPEAAAIWPTCNP